MQQPINPDSPENGHYNAVGVVVKVPCSLEPRWVAHLFFCRP